MTTTPLGVRPGTSEDREVTGPAVEEAVGRVRHAPGPALAAVHEPDLPAASAGARLLLQALGVDLAVESLARTPERMAAALAELVTPRPFRLTTFPNDGGYDELIVARSIPVRSLCEHHMLPFTGTAHIGYLPGERIVGLSKLARVMEHFSCRPQVQERLTVQVAEWLWTQLSPAGVGVVIEAEHLCMTLRGVQAPGSSTITSSLLGVLREDARSRAEFLALTGAR
ncbi:MAG TPA: GTP cyclohydrolase I FolE [Ornithinibacter sp.]|nr:GTP cyclohydrolase I FolE [Ornithinibacter sp.]